jgi:hypothetical protein
LNDKYIWNIINEGTINTLCLWKNHADGKRRHKFMLKEFLKGKKLTCDVTSDIYSENGTKEVKCNFVQDVRSRKYKNFKFKFRENGADCNQFESAVELFMISKKYLKNWKMRRKKPPDKFFESKRGKEKKEKICKGNRENNIRRKFFCK